VGVFRVVDPEDPRVYLVVGKTEKEARRRYVEAKPGACIFSVEKIPITRGPEDRPIDCTGAEWL